LEVLDKFCIFAIIYKTIKNLYIMAKAIKNSPALIFSITLSSILVACVLGAGGVGPFLQAILK
jgi:hypothetical protein